MKKQQKEGLEFSNSENILSLGVEIELQVLNGETLLLTPHAQDILEQSSYEKFDHEFFQSTLEIRTDICADAHEVENDLKGSLAKLTQSAKGLNLAIGSSGTHPLADYRENLITDSPRYKELTDRNKWIIQRMAVYGMHVHLGMQSGNACISNNYFFMHMLPHIMSLSASSPFWQGKNTGLASCRPTTYESLPTAGMPYMVKNWEEFQKLYQFLLNSSSIQSVKDLWWDIRPSPKYGTLELRFCDEPVTLYEMTGIVAFIHLLAYWFRDNEADWSSSHAPLKQWIMRENKWRTLRFGLDAGIVFTRSGKVKSLRKDILDWIKRLEPYAQQLKYVDYLAIVQEIAMKGNSAQRQHMVFKKTNDVHAVVRHNVMEFENGHPNWLV